jgi:quercetin dioxygenase-like cupin family protein
MKISGWFAPEASTKIITEWGSLIWMVNAALMERVEMTVGLVTINVGRSNPPHVHPNCEEIVYIVSGKCEQYVGDQPTELTVGEGMVIPRHIEHYAVNTGDEPLVVLVCYSSPNRETTYRDGSAAY